MLRAKNTDAFGQLGQRRARSERERIRSVTELDGHLRWLGIVRVCIEHVDLGTDDWGGNSRSLPPGEQSDWPVDTVGLMAST